MAEVPDKAYINLQKTQNLDIEFENISFVVKERKSTYYFDRKTKLIITYMLLDQFFKCC